MSDLKIKERLHSGIEQIKSNDALNELDNLVHAILSSEEDAKKGLTEAEKKAIEEGLSDAEEGRVISFEEAMKKYRKWVSK